MPITTFPSHEDVALSCVARPSWAEWRQRPRIFMLGVGEFRKRCPRCNLATSYSLSPAEATAVEFGEPDWKERFEAHCSRWPKLPRYLQEDGAFEATLLSTGDGGIIPATSPRPPTKG